MLKYKLKQWIWAVLLLMSLCGVIIVIMGVGQVVYYAQSGADPSSALNLIPTLPPDLDDRLSWQPDAISMQRLKKMDPFTRDQVADNYLRAWGQLGISYEVGRPYGLGTYFAGPALASVTQALTETLSAEWKVERDNLRHELQLTFFSDDGAVVGFTDHANHVVEYMTQADSSVVQIVESRGVYEGLLLLEDGSWRIRLWRRIENRPVEVPSSEPKPGFVTTDGRQLQLNGAPLYIAGLSYYPRDASWDLFWPTYDPAQTAVDLALMRSLGLNTVRIFVPYFDADDSDRAEEVLPNLVDFVDQVEAAGMWAIVTLFDHRTDHHPSFWAADDRYLALIIPLLAEHPALLAWDLKNEPDLDFDLNGEALVNAWLAHIAAEVRRYDRNHLLTVGWASPEAAANPVVAEFTELISFHYFGTAEEYSTRLQALQSALPQKPLLLGEFGYSTGNRLIPREQREAQQADFYRRIRQIHQTRETAGYLSWTLYDFNGVHLEQFATPWLRTKQANMGVVNLDGSIKPAAALLHPDADLDPPIEMPLPWWDFFRRLSLSLSEAN